MRSQRDQEQIDALRGENERLREAVRQLFCWLVEFDPEPASAPRGYVSGSRALAATVDSCCTGGPLPPLPDDAYPAWAHLIAVEPE